MNAVKTLSSKIKKEGWEVVEENNQSRGTQSSVFFLANNRKYVGFFDQIENEKGEWYVSRATWSDENTSKNFQLIRMSKEGKTFRTIKNFVNS